MAETCCSRPAAGSQVCDNASPTAQPSSHAERTCSVCGEKGKLVQSQTVKAMLSVTLRQVKTVQYLFCRTPTCPVVYFAEDGTQRFTVDQIRERVYQKESEADDVKVCYCFMHTVGEIRNASPENRAAILDDINRGIESDQCACDLRNPQGSCCLGNVRALLRQLEPTAGAAERLAARPA